MNLEDAQRSAAAIIQLIAPFCEPNQCVVAGSVRRLVPNPGDIEIVASPIIREPDKFFALRDLVNGGKFGRVVKGEVPSRYTQVDDGTRKVDFFWQDRSRWGLNLFIRTGSERFVADALVYWKKLTNGGYSEGAILHLADGTPVPTPTEEAVFEALKCKWVPPEKRSRA